MNAYVLIGIAGVTLAIITKLWIDSRIQVALLEEQLKELEKANALLEEQNNNDVSDVDSADGVWKQWLVTGGGGSSTPSTDSE